MDPLTAALLAGSGMSLFKGLFGGGDGGSGFQIPNLSPSQLPDVSQSLNLVNLLRKQGFDVLGRPQATEFTPEHLAPIIDSELMRVREQAQAARGRAAGEAESRGLTFSDIALGNLGGIDRGQMQAEADIRSKYGLEALGQASRERQSNNASALDFLMQNLGLTQSLAVQRDQTDLERQIAQIQAALGNAGMNRQAESERSSGFLGLGGDLAGLLAYLSMRTPVKAA